MAEAAPDTSRLAPDTPRLGGPTRPSATPGSEDLRDLLAARGDLTPAKVADLLLADQMVRWGRGERIPAETYLQLHPALTAVNPEAFDLIFNEFLLRQERREAPSLAEYL